MLAAKIKGKKLSDARLKTREQSFDNSTSIGAS